MDEVDDTQKRSEKRRLEAEFFSLESDRTRLTQKIDALGIDMRRTKLDMDHLKISLQEKEVAKSGLDRNLALMDADLATIKKKMNAL